MAWSEARPSITVQEVLDLYPRLGIPHFQRGIEDVDKAFPDDESFSVLQDAIRRLKAEVTRGTTTNDQG